MNKKWIVVLAALTLVGCETTSGSGVILPDEKKTIEINAELLKACEEPQELKSGTDKDNLAFTEQTLGALGQCSIRHKGLVKIVNDAFNVKAKGL